MGTRKKEKSKRRTVRKRRRRTPVSRLRSLATVVVPFFVLAAAVLVYFHVEVTSRFEGRLWDLPSRVYSSPLAIQRGSNVTAAALVSRLDRAGYARTDARPARAGEYRLGGASLEVFLREFESPGKSPGPRFRRLMFRGSRVVAIEDSDGRWRREAIFEPELLATLYGPQQEEREVVELDRIPPVLVQAVLAAEDGRFYSHHGVDAKAVARAAFANLRRGRIVQGGSTITQQTVKNLYLGQERTWWRKAREVVMAVLLDRRYSKDRILEVYLNEVYLGQRGPVAICGVQAASRFYFGKDIGDLSLAQCAMLAGLIRNPGGSNPFLHPDRALARRDRVLEAMHRLEFIEDRDVERARAEELRLASGAGGFSRAPYVIDFVLAQITEMYSRRVLSELGLKIHTTLNTAMQEAARDALRTGLERLERDAPLVRRQKETRDLQGLVLALNPATGEILAMVGGRDYRESQFNRAAQAARQPGSCFKPFVYLAGFESAIRGRQGGLTPATVLEDEPLEVSTGRKTWRPLNYDGRFRGPVSAREALESSLNVPTVRAEERVGIDTLVDVARRCGFHSFRPLPSLALGAQEVTPLELASAYAVLANGGRKTSPMMVRAVADADGRTLGVRRGKLEQAVSPKAAYLVTDILRGVLSEGTASSSRRLGFEGSAAGKTGTTDETRDAWFVGYTSEILVLVWVGYDDNARTGLSGATGALPIWVDFMRRIGLSDARAGFTEPEGIVSRVIDPESGMLAVGGCPARRRELFAAGTEPRENCPLHRPGLFRWLRERFRRRTL